MNALFDHLWQSTLFAAAMGVLTLAFRSNRAAVRHALWFMASLKFLVPFSALTVLGEFLFRRFDAAYSPPPLFLHAAKLVRPFSDSYSPSAVQTAPQPHLTAALLALWGCGFAVLSVLWLVKWKRLNDAVRNARSVSTARPLAVKASTGLLEPGLVGIWRPVLLVPESILERLSQKEMEAVEAHERCHLARRDNLTGAIHMLITNLFWFHPLLWWLSARLVEERERACDEAVLDGGSDPQVYAGSILKVCAFYAQSPLLCTSGMAGGGLKRRMETIMENKPSLRVSAAKRILLAAIAAIAVAMPLAVGASGPNGTSPSPLVRERLEEQRRPRQEIAFDPAQFDKYVGYYRINATDVFAVSRRANRYFVGVIGETPDQVYPESTDKFFLKGLSLPAQFSFTLDAAGRATEMVLHQSGEEQHAPRISGAEGSAAMAALAERVKSNTPSPGTKQAVLHQIEGLASGNPDYGRMAPNLAAGTRQMLAELHAKLAAWGPVMSIRFAGVGQNGMDIYEVTCRSKRSKWWIAPLTPDGRISSIFFGDET
jgi:beta-lactamase regulating signal transducer with metallopeptidase domain